MSSILRIHHKFFLLFYNLTLPYIVSFKSLELGVKNGSFYKVFKFLRFIAVTLFSNSPIKLSYCFSWSEKSLKVYNILSCLHYISAFLHCFIFFALYFCLSALLHYLLIFCTMFLYFLLCIFTFSAHFSLQFCIFCSVLYFLHYISEFQRYISAILHRCTIF